VNYGLAPGTGSLGGQLEHRTRTVQAPSTRSAVDIAVPIEHNRRPQAAAIRACPEGMEHFVIWASPGVRNGH
jgi:hypothetical protein